MQPILWFTGIAEILGFALSDPPQRFKRAWIGSVVGTMLKIMGSSAKIMPHWHRAFGGSAPLEGPPRPSATYENGIQGFVGSCTP